MADYLPDMVAPPPEPEPIPQNDHIPDNINEAVRETESDVGEMLPEEPMEVPEEDEPPDVPVSTFTDPVPDVVEPDDNPEDVASVCDP